MLYFDIKNEVKDLLWTKKGFLLIAYNSSFTEFIKIHNMKKKPLVVKKLASF